MNCPYCNKIINGMTGLIEAQNFQKHLGKCKKNPKRRNYVTDTGKIIPYTPSTGLLEALKIRSDSGQ